MGNVVSQETDVKGIVSQGRPRRSRRRIRVRHGCEAGCLAGAEHPAARLELPPIRYQIAVRRQLEPRKAAARAFIRRVTSKRGRLLLQASGLRRAQAVSRALFGIFVAVSAAVAFTFLLLPIVAIFLRVPIGDLLDQLGNDVARDALVVSLKTSAIAHAAVLLVGTPTAYLLARPPVSGQVARRHADRDPARAPAAVAGIGLLAAFGRFGLLGQELDALGIQIGFTQIAVILAVAFVESPSTCAGRLPPSKPSTRG